MVGSPFFSVIIPAYNRAASIVETLESVKNQTFQDFECLVVDDGSADGDRLRSVVDQLGDHRFHYIRRENGGGSAARNTGIEVAVGRYFSFLDSDDLFLPEKLEKNYVSIVENGNSNKIFLYSPVKVDRGEGRHWIKPPRGPSDGEDISEYLMCHQGWTQTSTIVLSNSFAKMLRFDELLPFAQDTDFAIRAAAAGANFIMHEEPLVIFNDINEGGRVSQNSKYKPVMDWLNRVRSIISPRAYYAYRGFHVARLVSHYDIGLAMRLYLSAILRGALPFPLICIAFIQIVLPKPMYRRLVNAFVAGFGKL